MRNQEEVDKCLPTPSAQDVYNLYREINKYCVKAKIVSVMDTFVTVLTSKHIWVKLILGSSDVYLDQ